jgi:hypothetical protein
LNTLRNGAPHQRRQAQRPAALVALVIALLLTACAEEPLPQRRINRSDCLRTIDMGHLPEALRRCDAVVAAFPKDPGPLNDRFLLLTLADKDVAACQDIRRAAALARGLPAQKLDSQLRHDLALRLADCPATPPGGLTNSQATGAPKPGTPDGAAVPGKGASGR